MTSPRGEPVRGVVADDDSLIRSVVRAALEEHGFSIVEASSGAEAIAASRSVEFAIIDARMPGLSLAATVAGLRAERWMPILVISGGTPSDELPVDVSYLSKPFDLAALLSSLDTLTRSLADRAGS
jgi:DNA-binding response OmpR family regulator